MGRSNSTTRAPGHPRTASKSALKARRRPPGAPRWLTVRSLVLLLVIAFAVVLVLPTLRQQLTHEQQLADLRAKVAAAKQHEEDLNADLDRWSDPAYVQSQARTRLGYVLPGETAYRVLDPQAAPTSMPSPLASPQQRSDPSDTNGETTWYLKLAQSFDQNSASR